MLVETVPREASPGELPALARLAEEVGFDGIAQTEVRQDPFLSVGLMATTTERVRLATGVAIAFARSPMVVAYLARNLQDLSNDRFALGLGTQVKGHVTRRFSMPWGAPGPRLREYVQALRAIWDCWQHGAPLSFRGDFYSFTLMSPEFNLGPSRFGPIRVHTAAVNTYNIQLAGELCDGLRIHPFSTPEYVRDVILPNLRIGAARAERSLESFELIGCGFVATGATEAEVAAAREEARKRVAFYASTPSYRPVLEHHGWGDLCPRLGELIKQGRWEALAGLVDDEVLERFCTAGTYDTIAREIERRLGGLVDWVTFPPFDGDPARREPLAQAVAETRRVPGRLGRAAA